MNDNGVSKKLYAFSITVTAIAGMAANAETKWPYAVAIGVAFVIYKCVQGFLDWSNNAKNDKS